MDTKVGEYVLAKLALRKNYHVMDMGYCTNGVIFYTIGGDHSFRSRLSTDWWDRFYANNLIRYNLEVAKRERTARYWNRELKQRVPVE